MSVTTSAHAVPVEARFEGVVGGVSVPYFPTNKNFEFSGTIRYDTDAPETFRDILNPLNAIVAFDNAAEISLRLGAEPYTLSGARISVGQTESIHGFGSTLSIFSQNVTGLGNPNLFTINGQWDTTAFFPFELPSSIDGNNRPYYLNLWMIFPEGFYDWGGEVTGWITKFEAAPAPPVPSPVPLPPALWSFLVALMGLAAVARPRLAALLVSARPSPFRRLCKAP